MKKKSGVLSKINIILTTILLISALAILVAVMTARQQNKEPKIFGLSFHIVVSPSMEPEIKVGDFVIAKSIDVSDIKVGDNIIFYSTDNNSQKIKIIHKVIKIHTDNPEIKFTTRGINNNADDAEPVEAKNVIGKYILRSHGVGSVIIWLSDMRNSMLILIFVVSIFLIINQLKAIFGNKTKNKEVCICQNVSLKENFEKQSLRDDKFDSKIDKEKFEDL